MAVDFRRSKLVCRTYSAPLGEGVSRLTSARSAWNGNSASWDRDICTVVRGGGMNCASRTRSNPTSDRSRGIQCHPHGPSASRRWPSCRWSGGLQWA